MPSDGDIPDADTAPAADRPMLVLVGTDGNAFSILGKARRVLRDAGRDDAWTTFEAEATSGDYDHLLATVMNWFEVE